MSIASRITSIEGHIGDIYDSVELTGVDTTDIDKNLVNVPNTLKEGYIDIINNGTDTLYNNFPKVSGEGTSLTLNNTYQAPMRNNLKGNTSQTGTPTPTNPIDVNVVSGDNEIEICGKNLFDKNSPNLVNGYLGAKGSITTNNSYRVSDYIYIGNYNDITISGNIGNGLVYCLYDGSKTFIGANSFNGSTLTRGVTSNIKYIRTTVSVDALNQYMLESGSTASTYEPYQGNIYNIDLPEGMELCKIGTYQDYIYKDSGKWYLHKEIGKVTYNGTENWTTFAINYEYQIILQDAKEGDFENQFFPSLCNKYVNHNVGGASLNNYEFSNFTSGVYRWIRIRHNDITTLANYKTWLASNTPTFYYLLATPTNTEITDTTLINQLEELYIAKSKENQTNISQINNDLGFIINASALKKG